MDFLLVSDNIIKNIAVFATPEDAELFGAKPYYAGARIGDRYSPPPEPPTQLDRIEAQVAYTALVTNTLLEEG